MFSSEEFTLSLRFKIASKHIIGPQCECQLCKRPTFPSLVRQVDNILRILGLQTGGTAGKTINMGPKKEKLQKLITLLQQPS